jgi:4-diphosphocytidyl-2-C-methyl-D-erythritol kinase
LFLHILGRRADGYHELQTCFQFVDLADLLSIEVRRDGEVRRHGGLPGLPAASDLCVRAALALRAATGCTLASLPARVSAAAAPMPRRRWSR